MICVCNKQSAVTHTFPLSPISSNGNNSVTNKQLRDFFFSSSPFSCGISIVGGWWFFFCIVLETASLGNWESQTADEMSPHELSPCFHTLTNSHVGDLTHTLPLKHSLSFFSSPSTHARTHTHCKDLSSTPCQAQRHTTLSKQAESRSFSHAADCCLSRPVTLDHIMSDMPVL